MPPYRLRMKIEPVHVSWSDNWMYLITDEATQEGAVVDPWDHEGMAKKVKDAGVKVSWTARISVQCEQVELMV
jgi:hydroxyacylglutathione hydrolase